MVIENERMQDIAAMPVFFVSVGLVFLLYFVFSTLIDQYDSSALEAVFFVWFTVNAIFILSLCPRSLAFRLLTQVCCVWAANRRTSARVNGVALFVSSCSFSCLFTRSPSSHLLRCRV
jgi:hypothetical protein